MSGCVSRICFLSFCLMISSISCSKKEPLFLATGITSAQLNGVNWSASNFGTYSSINDLFGITTTLRNSLNQPIEKLSITNFSDNLDTIFFVYPPASDLSPRALYTSTDLDAICELFHLSPNHLNFLIIDSIHEETGYMAGRFEFVFVKELSSACSSSLPDSLWMENGRFETVVTRR